MNLQRLLGLVASLAFFAVLASGGISYTCDPSVDATMAGTCSTLNTTISGLYSSTFSNANASIYIQYGTTGLGSSTPGFDNQISYADYLADLAATGSSNAVDTAALASLPATEPALYGGAPVDISSALGMALGLSSLNGTTAGGSLCTVGTAGCYNGIITITNDPSTLLYYRTGVQNPDSYELLFHGSSMRPTNFSEHHPASIRRVHRSRTAAPIMPRRQSTSFATTVEPSPSSTPRRARIFLTTEGSPTALAEHSTIRWRTATTTLTS